MAVPRGVNISDMNARMAASYVPRRATLGTAEAVEILTAVDEFGNPIPGNIFYPGDRTLHTVTVSGTFDADVVVQGSPDNVNWQTLVPTTIPTGSTSAGTISAPGVFVYQGNYRSLRGNCTSYTSGTAVVQVESTRG